MSAHDKQQERAAKVAQVIAEHPGLPIKVLAPSTPCDYSTYWHDATGARTTWLLYPEEVQGSDLRDYCGLESERVYDDEWEAAEDVSGWLFDRWWDEALAHGMRYEFRQGETADDVLAKFCGYEPDVSLFSFADEVARRMVEGMPWQKCVVIDCY